MTILITVTRSQLQLLRGAQQVEINELTKRALERFFCKDSVYTTRDEVVEHRYFHQLLYKLYHKLLREHKDSFTIVNINLKLPTQKQFELLVANSEEYQEEINRARNYLNDFKCVLHLIHSDYEEIYSVLAEACERVFKQAQSC